MPSSASSTNGTTHGTTGSNGQTCVDYELGSDAEINVNAPGALYQAGGGVSVSGSSTNIQNVIVITLLVILTVFIAAASGDLLEKARRDAETFDVEVETHTILSHRSFDEIFDAAQNQKADLTLLGWGEDAHGSPGRVESAMDDLTGALPSDFIVYREYGFEPDRMLLPTAGGPASEISAEVARVLMSEFDSELTLMHVVDDERERSQGETFLEHWAEEHGFEEAGRLVEVSDEPYEAIRKVAGDYTLVILGATERGLLQRLADRHGLAWMIDQLDVSVLLAEPSRPRSLWARLFGGK